MTCTGCLRWIGSILNSYCGFIFDARHFFPSFLHKNDEEKCLAPKTKPQLAFRKLAIHIDHPVRVVARLLQRLKINVLFKKKFKI